MNGCATAYYPWCKDIPFSIQSDMSVEVVMTDVIVSFLTKLITSDAIIALIACAIVVGSRDIVQWVRKRLSKQRSLDIAGMNRFDMQVHELLSELRLATQAQRTAYCQFHNGETYFSGSSIQRVSVTHESLDEGVLPLRTVRIGVPVSVLAPLIEQMLRDEAVPICVGSMVESYAKRDLEALGTASFLVLPIRVGLQIVGYLKVHWSNADHAWGKGDVATTCDIVKRMQQAVAANYNLTHK